MSEYVYEHGPRAVAAEKLAQGFVVSNAALEEIKYRWEFLRRNKDYINDYGKSLKEVEYFRELTSISETGPSELDFCKKWRLGVPISPKKKYDALRKDVEKEVKKSISFSKSLGETFNPADRERFIRLFLEAMLKPTDYFFSTVSGWEHFLFTDEREIFTSNDEHLKRFGEKGEVSFTINFNYSAAVIKKEFSKVVKIFDEKYKCLKKEGKVFAQELEEEINKLERKIKKTKKAIDNKRCKQKKSQLRKLKAMMKERKSTKEKIDKQNVIPHRNQFDHYDDYLKIWDLYQKMGNKWTRIAEEVFPNDDAIDKGKGKVIKSYKVAECLINEMGLNPTFQIFTRTEPYTM